MQNDKTRTATEQSPNKAVNRSGGSRVICLPAVLAAARLPWSFVGKANAVDKTVKELPAQLHYKLNRKQRLIPHLKLWGAMGPSFVAFFVMFLAASFKSAWFVLAALIAAWFSRRYILGLVDVLLNPIREMDIIIEPLGIGYLAGNERWYIHMDGVLSIQHLANDVWTISHHNGTVINIPMDTMPDVCVAHIRAAITGKWSYLQPFADEHRRKLDASANDNYTP